MSSEEKMVWIRTRRYSEFFRRLLQEYARDTVAMVDARSYPSSEFPKLIEAWCTNAQIKKTQEFLLSRGEEELCGFHDHPDQLWAAASELPFLERLASERILRFRVSRRGSPQRIWLQAAIVVLVLAGFLAIIRLLSWLAG